MRHWRRYGRHDLPWRPPSLKLRKDKSLDPYKVLVSEMMLQQTQVARVIDAYAKFLRAFPSFRVLARATPFSVLKVWQGLGYNRRALMLLRCAKVVVGEYKGALPDEYEALRALPGIGPYTAGAVLAFAFNRPVPVVETNIRRVYLHHFFPRSKNVSDLAILKLVTRHLLLVPDVRCWYSALMDYGSWLATQTPNPNVRSKHYTRQPMFEGSQRQLRGAVVRFITKHESLTLKQLREELPDARLARILSMLEREGFVVRCAHARCVSNPHWSLR